MQEHQIRFCCDCRDKHTQREFITQKRETDYAFFCRLAAEEGITFWFEVNKGEAQCLYTDSFLSLLGGDTLEYNDHPQSSTEGDFAYQMNLSARMTPQKAMGKDRTYLHPRFPYQHEVRGETLLGVNTSLYTIYDSFARFPDYDSAEQMTRYRLDVLQRESEYGEGESNCFALRPGYYFRLCGHPFAALNEKWQVTWAVHHGVLPQSGQEDFSDTAASLTNHFRFIWYYKNWRPTFIPKPIADGPEVAEVVGPAGEEIFTNKQGQVKVHFHWNLYDEADEKASCWVRVMQGWSGRGYGFYAIPRIGQEVIVSYINGDIDRPIITGCTYNDIMALPVQLPEKKTQTVFRTQTHKGQGHNELRFDDATGNELLHLHAQKDMDIHVLNDHTVNVEHDSKHHIKNDSHLKIDNEYRVHAKNDISLSTTSDLHINADQGIFAQGKSEIHLQSGMKIVIDAGAEITLQAANNFIKIDSTGIHTSSVFNVGSGSAGKGTGWRGKLPSGLFTEITQLLPLSRNQRLVLLSNTPFCEECEKCKQEGGCAI